MKNKKFEKFNQLYFEELSISNPEELVKLLSSNELSSNQLTFAAEIAGTILTESCFDSLIKLLNHESSVVKEGAIYGLLNHMENTDRKLKFVDELNKILEFDKSVILRSLVLDILKSLRGIFLV